MKLQVQIDLDELPVSIRKSYLIVDIDTDWDVFLPALKEELIVMMKYQSKLQEQIRLKKFEAIKEIKEELVKKQKYQLASYAKDIEREYERKKN